LSALLHAAVQRDGVLHPMLRAAARGAVGRSLLAPLGRIAHPACSSRAAPCCIGLLPRFSSSSASVALGSSAAGLGLDPVMKPFQSGRPAKPKRVTAGVLAIQNTWNNTIVTVTDINYKVKSVVSAGQCGFKKSKRSSFFAMEKTVAEAFARARTAGLRKVMINMTGPAVVLRKPLMKQIREETKIRVMKIRMSHSVPWGGCRPRKSRRRRYKTRARKK